MSGIRGSIRCFNVPKGIAEMFTRDKHGISASFNTNTSRVRKISVLLFVFGVDGTWTI